MIRYNASLLFSCAVVFAVAGVAYGAASKIKWFDNISEPNPDADGMAILNYVAGQNETVVQIVISDFLPERTYTLRLTDGTSQLVGDVTTDHHGHATFHRTYSLDKSTWDVEVYLDENGDLVLSPDELRAFGDNPAT